MNKPNEKPGMSRKALISAIVAIVFVAGPAWAVFLYLIIK